LQECAPREDKGLLVISLRQTASLYLVAARG
jgi:hypothetical protein